MYVERYLPYVGKSGHPQAQVIEKVAIACFAEALGETDPVYYDKEYAKTTKYGGIIAPPTFTATLRCPPVPGVWRAPAGQIHAGQRYRIYRPLKAGETVWCRETLEEAYEKEGSKGLMVFTVTRRDITDADGNLCVQSWGTMMTRAALFEAADAAAKQASEKTVDVEPGRLVETICFDALREGMELPSISLEPYTAVSIAKYAAGSLDFNAIHIDDDAARNVGFKSRVGHGMIAAGLQARVVKLWLGPDVSVADLQMRFAGPVYCGDTPTFYGKVTSVDGQEGRALIEYMVKNQESLVVLSGSVEVCRL